MPHAALWVVQLHHGIRCRSGYQGFNAARGFVGGAATKEKILMTHSLWVSMPHAALWVVQPRRSQLFSP